MAGLKRNLTEFHDSLEPFSEIPFTFLQTEKQAIIAKNLSTIISNILSSLGKESLEKTIFYVNTKKLQLSVSNGVDEQKFALYLKPFLEALSTSHQSRAFQAINPVAEKFLDRIQPFYISEAQAVKYRESHGKDEIQKHDTDIIDKTLQIYAMDYFLLAYKNLCISPDKKSLIISGIDKAPALIDDALADDMLKKVVYSLYGKDIRKRMIRDYYTYKQVFLTIPNDVDLTDEKISEITEALRKYCLSLIDISLEYGITSFKHSLLEPYGPNADLAEIKKQISNVAR